MCRSPDPETLLELGPQLTLSEPVVARPACDGERVIAVGSNRLFALRLDRDSGRLVVDQEWAPRYDLGVDRSYGWDPVIAEPYVFRMDNGRNRVDRTMLGSGEVSSPLRLWRARLDSVVAAAVPGVSGAGGGRLA